MNNSSLSENDTQLFIRDQVMGPIDSANMEFIIGAIEATRKVCRPLPDIRDHDDLLAFCDMANTYLMR